MRESTDIGAVTAAMAADANERQVSSEVNILTGRLFDKRVTEVSD